MSLLTAHISMLALTKMDGTDVCEYLEGKGFDLRYKYMMAKTIHGVDFYQFLDAGSLFRNPNIDPEALMHHIFKSGLNTQGVEG